MALLRLEVFETPSAVGKTTVVTDLSALEEARLAAFEQGYVAGWEDAGAAQADDQTRIRADLARNLQALSFTYHEARAHVVASLEPLLTDILDRLLPDLARPTLGPTVRNLMMAAAKDMAGTPVTLVLNPSVHDAVEQLLQDGISLPLQIIDEPTLSEGQAYLRLGDTETRIDTDRAADEIRSAIRDFFALAKEGTPHGKPV
jgi:hypothetical protein